jgi:hypothetical protein
MEGKGMARFTPGPWRVSADDPTLFPSVIFHDRAPGSRPAQVCINEGADSEALRRGEYHGTTMETARATAHLIAAAPDLYDALSKLANEVAAICAIAEASIREAAGNTNYSVLWQRQAEATIALAKARGEGPIN